MTTLGDTENSCSQLLREMFPLEEAQKCMEVKADEVVARISKVVERDLSDFQESFTCSDKGAEEVLKRCYKHLSKLYPDDLEGLICQIRGKTFPELEGMCSKVRNDNLKTLELIEALTTCRHDDALILLTQITNVDAIDENGNTALLMAAKRGYIDVAKSLLEKGADINFQNEKGESALMLASSAGQLESIAYLLDQGADKELQNYYEETALLCAVEKRQQGAARLLVGKGANVEVPSKEQEGKYISALINSIDFEDLSWSELFLQNGAHINLQDKNGFTALYWAVSKRDMGAVRFLLDSGADPERRTVYGGTTPLIEAARRSFWEDFAPPRSVDDRRFVRFLLDRGADIDAQITGSYGEGNTALMEAVSSKKISLVRYFVGRNADVDIQNEDGESALTLAVAGGSIEMVELLLSKKADYSVTDRSGRTLLDILVGSYSTGNKKELALLLLEAGLDIDEEDGEGNTSLMRATRGYNLESLQLLIDLGADIHKRNHEGKSALNLAQDNFRHDMERLLIERGALFHSYEEPGAPPRAVL